MKDTIRKRFLALSSQEKALVLARSSHDLTVFLRGAAIEEDPEARERIKALNEVLHSMTGKLRDLLLDTQDQYPDDVFLGIISEKAQRHCAKALDHTLERAISKAHH